MYVTAHVDAAPPREFVNRTFCALRNTGSTSPSCAIGYRQDDHAPCVASKRGERMPSCASIISACSFNSSQQLVVFELEFFVKYSLGVGSSSLTTNSKYHHTTTARIPRSHMEPDQQSTQCPPRRKRETLEMIKCAFCRTAKQKVCRNVTRTFINQVHELMNIKCLPIVRQWPDQKCTRCLEKNLQCSEGQRAMRGKRQSLALTTSVIGPQDQHIVQVHNTPTRIHRRELLAYITAVQSRLPPAYGTYTESSQPPANTADHRMKKQLRDA